MTLYNHLTIILWLCTIILRSSWDFVQSSYNHLRTLYNHLTIILGLCTIILQSSYENIMIILWEYYDHLTIILWYLMMIIIWSSYDHFLVTNSPPSLVNLASILWPSYNHLIYMLSSYENFGIIILLQSSY